MAIASEMARRLVGAVAVLFLAAPGFSQDWPQWRGPTGMGHCDESGLPLTWDARTGANILWKAPLRGSEDLSSPGHSCPIVWRDRVFVTTAVWPAGRSFRDKSIAEHHVLCYRAGDGMLLWDTRVP